MHNPYLHSIIKLPTQIVQQKPKTVLIGKNFGSSLTMSYLISQAIAENGNTILVHYDDDANPVFN